MLACNQALSSSGWAFCTTPPCSAIFCWMSGIARILRSSSLSRAMTAGARALGLEVFGDDATRMSNVTGVVIPAGVDGERVRRRMREDFEIEIGTAFGPLQGRVWRIGAMGYNAAKHKVLITLGALETVLRAEGFACPPGAGVEAALAAWTRELSAEPLA